MKRILAVSGAAAVLGATSVAFGAIGQTHGNAIVLRPGQADTYAGLTCTTYPGTTPTNWGLTSVRTKLMSER